MGHSAGAYIAAHLSLDPRYLNGEGLSRDIISGMIGISGPYAFNPLEYRSVRDIFAGHPDPRDLRPINFADGSAPPMLLLHGGDDGTVYPMNSRLLAQKINAAGGEARYVEIDDTGHIAIVLALAKPFRRDGGVLDTAMEFIGDREAETLAGRTATPASEKTFRR
jgi:acetyl esterase/lipase